MKIKPLDSYRLLGTPIQLEKGKTYTASHARNQPNWKEKGLIFVHERRNNPTGFLLARGEYEIVKP